MFLDNEAAHGETDTHALGLRRSEQLYRIYEIEIGVPVTLELIRTRVHPDDVSLIERMKMVDQARDGSEFEWQYRLLMPDHSVKHIHAVGHVIRDRDGQPEYIAAVQDVTSRRESEETLAKARSELAKVARATSLGVLTASIAHEVNQPLSGIITNASTCLRMLDGDPPNVGARNRQAGHSRRQPGGRRGHAITCAVQQGRVHARVAGSERGHSGGHRAVVE